MQLSTRNHAHRLTADAMFVALYVLFSRFLSIPTPITELSFASIPILLAAGLYGFDAILIGTVGSFIEQLLSPYGLSATTVLWMAPVILQATVACLAFTLFRRRPLWATVLIIVVCEILLTVTNTAMLYLDGYIMQYSVKALNLIVIPRAINGGARLLVSCLVIPLLLPRLQSILHTKQ